MVNLRPLTVGILAFFTSVLFAEPPTTPTIPYPVNPGGKIKCGDRMLQQLLQCGKTVNFGIGGAASAEEQCLMIEQVLCANGFSVGPFGSACTSAETDALLCSTNAEKFACYIEGGLQPRGEKASWGIADRDTLRRCMQVSKGCKRTLAPVKPPTKPPPSSKICRNGVIFIVTVGACMEDEYRCQRDGEGFIPPICKDGMGFVGDCMEYPFKFGWSCLLGTDMDDPTVGDWCMGKLYGGYTCVRNEMRGPLYWNDNKICSKCGEVLPKDREPKIKPSYWGYFWGNLGFKKPKYPKKKPYRPQVIQPHNPWGMDPRDSEF